MKSYSMFAVMRHSDCKSQTDKKKKEEDSSKTQADAAAFPVLQEQEKVFKMLAFLAMSLGRG